MVLKLCDLCTTNVQFLKILLIFFQFYICLSVVICILNCLFIMTFLYLYISVISVPSVANIVFEKGEK